MPFENGDGNQSANLPRLAISKYSLKIRHRSKMYKMNSLLGRKQRYISWLKSSLNCAKALSKGCWMTLRYKRTYASASASSPKKSRNLARVCLRCRASRTRLLRRKLRKPRTRYWDCRHAWKASTKYASGYLTSWVWNSKKASAKCFKSLNKNYSSLKSNNLS